MNLKDVLPTSLITFGVIAEVRRIEAELLRDEGARVGSSTTDLGATRRIENRWIASRCGWTPFDGMETVGWPVATVITGRLVMREVVMSWRK